jgi:penicillin-binding protein 1C
MANLSRPREEKSWQLFGYDHKVAWKTGTSYGHKDAWAAGFNGIYQVLVWVGNEKGEGRKDLTGIVRAAPVMFKIFNSLPHKSWFSSKPDLNLKNSLLVCKETGLLKGSLCKSIHSLKTSHSSLHLKTCNYHTIEQNGDTILKFHPLIEYYYTAANPSYKKQGLLTSINLIYPSDGMKIYLPKLSKGIKNSFKAKCISSGKRIHWYLNDKFIITTIENEVLLSVIPGMHKLSVFDDDGNSAHCNFEILRNEDEERE